MPPPALTRLLRSVAANIRLRRLELDWTQEDLAEAADLDLNSLRRVETARTNPSVGTMLKIAMALGVDVATLLRPAHLPKPRRGRPPKSRTT